MFFAYNDKIAVVIDNSNSNDNDNDSNYRIECRTILTERFK